MFRILISKGPGLFRNQLNYHCLECGYQEKVEKQRERCDCGGLLRIEVIPRKLSLAAFRAEFRENRLPSGVWRYKAWHLDLPYESVSCRGEGNTRLYHAPVSLKEYTGVERLRLKHEGENPTGSFKDRGMSVAIAAARLFGAKSVACASTGNTSASMAAYAAYFGLKAFVVLPKGKTALGKISQALAYGANTLEIEGSFDDALEKVQEACRKTGTVLLNSINPFRIEGQKTIGFELLEDLNFEIPDWIVLPGGNLGNVSAIGKAFLELKSWGFIEKLPRFAVIQAEGAAPFARMVQEKMEYLVSENSPETIATAIRIGKPVSWKKALDVMRATNGVSLALSDEKILEAKARVDRGGIGAEPASCASVGGVKALVDAGVIQSGESVVCILTGNVLKDPEIVLKTCSDPQSPAYCLRQEVENSYDAIARIMEV